MRINRPVKYPVQTHEGGPAMRISAEKQLRRSVLACLLWEGTFYEDGQSVAERIAATVPLVAPEVVAQLALEARGPMKLRHVPLLLMRELARAGKLRGKDLAAVIQRADELTEFLAIYWKDGRQPLSKQVKYGLAEAFRKFNEYALAKYNGGGAVKLRDALFLCHAKPADEAQAALWKRLVDGTLATPDTWETQLSAGKDKKETFTRLVKEKKLGALATLRNLRNMEEAGVDIALMREAVRDMKIERVLPFRFIAAAKHAPRLAAELSDAMLKCVEGFEKIPGETGIMVDVSGSMDGAMFSDRKSEMTPLDKAAGLAILARELCENVNVATFSDALVGIPNFRGLSLRDHIANSQPHRGTYLGRAIAGFADKFRFDRLIVITDEQAHDQVQPPVGWKGYLINVGTYQNGVGYGPWTHIDGFSENTLRFITELEKNN